MWGPGKWCRRKVLSLRFIYSESPTCHLQFLFSYWISRWFLLPDLSLLLQTFLIDGIKFPTEQCSKEGFIFGLQFGVRGASASGTPSVEAGAGRSLVISLGQIRDLEAKTSGWNWGQL